MGADLIGYMVIGPKTIHADSIVKAHKKAKHIIAEMIAWYHSEEATCQEELQYLSNYGIDHPCQLENLDIEPNIADMQLEDVNIVAEQLVNKIVNFWQEPESTDCVYRETSDTEKCVFCGDQTWGDMPDGYGYNMLYLAHVFDIDNELGWR